MIINGRQIANEILESLKVETSLKNLKLTMVAVLVGDKPGLKTFVKLKGKAANSVGVDFQSYFFPENISEDLLLEKVREIAGDSIVSGVFIELPLPKHINVQNILNTIPASKDLDILSKPNQDRFFSGDFYILPPAVEAVKIIFDKHNIKPAGKKAAVFGYGFLVGKPVSYWLEKRGAEVSVIRSSTENTEKYSQQADIIISGVGKPGLIKGDMVKEGALVIDFGYSKKDNKMAGDVDFDSVVLQASLITPVPGGVGPILIAAVLKNLVKLNS